VHTKRKPKDTVGRSKLEAKIGGLLRPKSGKTGPTKGLTVNVEIKGAGCMKSKIARKRPSGTGRFEKVLTGSERAPTEG